jgi:3-methyladenine DNA glycosylase/8-oxoguanine DNA glycosylase
MPARRFPAPDPLDLRATIGVLGMKASGQPAATATEAWRMSHTPDGPGTVRLVRDGDQIEAEAWGRGADWLLEHAADLVGVDDDPDAFDPPPGLVRELHRRARGLRMGRTGLVVEAMVPAVFGQKVTTKEAGRSFRRLIARHGLPAPGPRRWQMVPSPETLAGLDYTDFHRLGVERKRAAIITEVARRARRLEAATEMPLADAERRLTAVSGIGVWTAGHVRGIALGDPDAVPVGDYHLPNTVAWSLAGEPRATDERMLELLEPYRGHRRRVITLLKRAGVAAPKYGPRTALRSFERH